MSTSTTRLGLVKPAGSENYDITIFNANADKTDTAAGRLIVTSSTRPSSPFSGQCIFETDTGNELFWDGTGWAHEDIAVVSATSQILRPQSNQTIFNTADNTYYQRVGAAWQPTMPGPLSPASATRGDAMYSAATSQAIGNAANTVVLLGTANRTSALVTAGTTGAGSNFTLNRGGVWNVGGTARFFGSANAGERYAEVRGGPASANVLVAQGNQAVAGGTPSTLNVDVTRWMDSGDVVTMQVFQSSGISVSLDNGSGGAWVRLHLNWLHG